MILEQFRAAIAVCRTTAQIDDIGRLLWKAHLEEAIGDNDGQAAAEMIAARRAAIADPSLAASLDKIVAVKAPPKRVRPRSPDRQASLERRRRCAMSGAMPAPLGAHFTMGEIAALTVIAREVKKAGVCVLPIDGIAAIAGVSRTTTQNAVRRAVTLKLLQRTERRRRGSRSLTNLLHVVSAEWLAWLQHGRQKEGLKNLSPTYNSNVLNRSSPVTNTSEATSQTGLTEGKTEKEGLPSVPIPQCSQFCNLLKWI